MTNQEIIKSLTERVNGELYEKRRVHTLGVLDTALSLSEKYGADPEKAEIAALAHDLYRGLRGEELNDTVRELGLPEKYIDDPNLAHGKIAAIRLREDYGLEDEDIINAVSYHTTGRAGMSTLEKVIYLADAIEPGRDYPGVDELRKEAERGLDEACLMAMENTIRHVRDQGAYLDEDTLEAEDHLKKVLNTSEGEQMTNKEYAYLAAQTLSNKKATDIVVIDIAEKSGFADYFIIATGNTERQINSLCDDIEDLLEKEGLFAKSIEGKNVSGWILLDFGDVIINLFTPDMRDRYNIEKVWADCPVEHIGD